MREWTSWHRAAMGRISQTAIYRCSPNQRVTSGAISTDGQVLPGDQRRTMSWRHRGLDSADWTATCVWRRRSDISCLHCWLSRGGGDNFRSQASILLVRLMSGLKWERSFIRAWMGGFVMLWRLNLSRDYARFFRLAVSLFSLDLYLRIPEWPESSTHTYPHLHVHTYLHARERERVGKCVCPGI